MVRRVSDDEGKPLTSPGDEVGEGRGPVGGRSAIDAVNRHSLRMSSTTKISTAGTTSSEQSNTSNGASRA